MGREKATEMLIDIYESAMEWICGKDGFFIVVFISIAFCLFFAASEVDMLQNAADGTLKPNQSSQIVDRVAEDFAQ